MIVKIKTFSGENLYIPEEDYLNEVMYSDLEEREFASRREMKKVGNLVLDAQLGRKLSPRAKSFIGRVTTSGKVLRDVPSMAEAKKSMPIKRYRKLGLGDEQLLAIKKEAEEMSRGKSIPERRKMVRDMYKQSGYI